MCTTSSSGSLESVTMNHSGAQLRSSITWSGWATKPAAVSKGCFPTSSWRWRRRRCGAFGAVDPRRPPPPSGLAASRAALLPNLRINAGSADSLRQRGSPCSKSRVAQSGQRGEGAGPLVGRARSSSLGCSAKEHGISASFAIDQAFLKSEPLASWALANYLNLT